MAVDLLIAGAGGFARETAAAVDAVNRLAGRRAFRLLGFLDDEPALQGTTVSGRPVLGELQNVHRYPNAALVVCIGNPRRFDLRAQVVARLELPADRYATVVHPHAVVGTGARVGPGCVLLAQAVLTADATVGAHVAVMPQVVLTHDTVVGDYATLASGVRLGGGVHVGAGAYLGAGCLVRDGLCVGAGAQVGTGAVVLQDIPAGEVWVGNPARRLRLTAQGIPVPAHAKGEG
jgi:sugar O-acyltransferase (sialic acid O-acetyltransferase NeuD family)